MTPALGDWLKRDAAWQAAGAAALVAIALGLAQAYATPDNMQAPTFGTALAPYSDALMPWLDGGLAFLFGLPPPSYLYRPTIGMYWGTILATTGRIETIPVFFFGWFLVFFSAVFALARVRAVRDAFVIALAAGAMSFPAVFGGLYLATTNVDFPALVITSTGALLLLCGRGEQSRPALFVGCLCLGIAAAIRGPMMLAALPMLAVRMFLIERLRARTIVLAAACFLAPIVLDAVLQRHYNVVNNGIVGIYCAATDPSHAWTAACHEKYLATRPGAGEVVMMHLRFIFAEGGWHYFYEVAARRVERDLSWFSTRGVLVALAAAGVLATLRDPSWRSSLRAPWRLPAAPAFAVVLAAAAFRLFGGHYWKSGLVLVALALVAAAATRRWRSLFALAGYATGTVYLSVFGLGSDRLQNTFGFLLFVGVALLFLEPKSDEEQDRPPFALAPRALPFAVAGVFAFLYLGSFVVPSSLRDTFHARVYQKPGFALKLGGDSRIDRSLYVLGDRNLIYTRHDALPVGAVRTYSGATTQARGNFAFVAPVAFID